MSKKEFIERQKARHEKKKENRREWLSLILFFAMCLGTTWIASAIAMIN